MRLAAKKRPSGYHTLNFIAIDLQLHVQDTQDYASLVFGTQ